MAKSDMAKRPLPRIPGAGGEHDSSYLHMAVGGKVASDLLKAVGGAGGKLGGAISGLVGQISRRNRDKAPSPGAMRKMGVHDVATPKPKTGRAPAKKPSGMKPALKESGQYGAPLPGGRRVVTKRDAEMNKRLKELE